MPTLAFVFVFVEVTTPSRINLVMVMVRRAKSTSALRRDASLEDDYHPDRRAGSAVRVGTIAYQGRLSGWSRSKDHQGPVD